MDKNNDIQVNKVNKWDYGVVDMSLWHLKDEFDALVDKLNGVYGIDVFEIEELTGDTYSSMDKVLERFNELEAVHQKECGMISDYAEENALLKRKNEKASNNIRDLRRVLEENDIATYLNPVTVSWGVANVALQKKTEHFNAQLDNLREKLREDERSKEKWIARYHNMSDICSRDEDDSEMLQAILRKDGYTIEYDGDIDDETICCQDSFDLCKETTQDEVLYQYGRWTLIRPLNFSEAKANADAAILRKQCARHIDLLDKLRWALEDKGILVEWSEAALKWNLYDKNKSIDELKQHYEDELRIRCEEIDGKNKLIDELKQIIEELEIKTSYYVAHITSHKREIEKLEKKIKELERKNTDLKLTLSRCERDANVSRSLCHNIAFNAERARKQGDDI